jgi:hypothetical protein
MRSTVLTHAHASDVSPLLVQAKDRGAGSGTTAASQTPQALPQASRADESAKPSNGSSLDVFGGSSPCATTIATHTTRANRAAKFPAGRLRLRERSTALQSWPHTIVSACERLIQDRARSLPEVNASGGVRGTSAFSGYRSEPIRSSYGLATTLHPKSLAGVGP